MLDEKEYVTYFPPVSLSVRDLQQLGKLQTELAGAADFCATYLHCQLLLMKVGVCVSVCFLKYHFSEA